MALYLNNVDGQVQLMQKLLYTALGRCKSLSGLYFFGAYCNSVRKERTITQLRVIERKRLNEDGRIEMERMREESQLLTESDPENILDEMFQMAENNQLSSF